MAIPTLYSLSTQYRALQALDLEEIDEDTFLATLDGLEGDLQVKASNVVAYQKNVQAYADMASDAAKKMAERAKLIQHKADSLKIYIKRALEAGGITKLEGPEFYVAIQKNPPSVKIDGEVPAEFMVQPPTPEPYPNKTAIAAAIKAGQEVPGAHLEQSTRLVIK